MFEAIKHSIPVTHTFNDGTVGGVPIFLHQRVFVRSATNGYAMVNLVEWPTERPYVVRVEELTP